MTVGSSITKLLNAVEQDQDRWMLNDHLGINRCTSRQELTEMTLRYPTVMIPLRGTKEVLVGDNNHVITPGKMAILPSGTSFNVINMPNDAGESYQGVVINFDAKVLENFQTLYGSSFDAWDLSPRWQTDQADRLLAILADWVAHLQEFGANDVQARHKLAELLLVMAEGGMAGNLLVDRHSVMSDRIRHRLSLDPAREWRSADVAATEGVSESTLRRMLREENASFRGLLEQVRLEHAVELVMFTAIPVGEVAHRCGYTSQSRFAGSFRRRFSMSPTELRASQGREIPQAAAAMG